MAKFKKLFEPGCIGKLKLQNRIMQAPMWTGFAARDGSVTPRLLNYCKERAQGGTGLIIVEFSYIDEKASQSLVCQLGIYGQSLIPGLSTLARVIKDNGAKAGIQICHAGRRRLLGTYPIVAPSRMPWEALGDIIPSELTIEEIKEIVKAFGNAARIAEQSGFDMLEIHGAHGYLITEFLSPYTNRRGDIYGGSLRDRMRFALEVVDSVRRNVSRDFPLCVRISATEYTEGGITIEDSKVFAQELEKAGVDVIHVSAGMFESLSSVIPMLQPLARDVYLVEEIKEVVHIPAIASGAITSPQLAEEILEKGQADFISLARPLLADPYFARKAEEGRPEDIVPCIRCNDGCLSRGMSINRAVSCTVNISAGFEGEFDIQPARAKKIAVIGGGPGGMEAARVAALRCHDVTLYDEHDRLGGCLLEVSVLEFKKDLMRLIDYLSTQLTKLGVKVVLGKEATVQIIQQQGFDVVVLATGSMPFIPDVRGIDKQSIITALDVLRGKQVGQNVVVAGGGLVGCEVALFLAKQGKQIRIIEVLENAMSGVDREEKRVLTEGFSKYAVKINSGLSLEEVVDRGVVAVDKYGERYNFTADSIIFALGFERRDDLLEGLEKANMTVCPVGDCVEPRRIYDAIHEGFLASHRL